MLLPYFTGSVQPSALPFLWPLPMLPLLLDNLPSGVAAEDVI